MLVVESGLVYLGFQVSHFGYVRRRSSLFRQIVYTALYALSSVPPLEMYAFQAVFFSLSVSLGQTEDFHHDSHAII